MKWILWCVGEGVHAHAFDFLWRLFNKLRDPVRCAEHLGEFLAVSRVNHRTVQWNALRNPRIARS